MASTKLSSRRPLSTPLSESRAAGRATGDREELTEGKSININALKQIVGVGHNHCAVHSAGQLRVYQASHTLLATTNYIPIVNERLWELRGSPCCGSRTRSASQDKSLKASD